MSTDVCDDAFDFLVGEYSLGEHDASLVPLAGWATGDLLLLCDSVHAELLARAYEAEGFEDAAKGTPDDDSF